jgi:hypothetical protein
MHFPTSCDHAFDPSESSIDTVETSQPSIHRLFMDTHARLAYRLLAPKRVVWTTAARALPTPPLVGIFRIILILISSPSVSWPVCIFFIVVTVVQLSTHSSRLFLIIFFVCSLFLSLTSVSISPSPSLFLSFSLLSVCVCLWIDIVGIACHYRVVEVWSCGPQLLYSCSNMHWIVRVDVRSLKK